ncbi:hypothetical protein C8F01DRAFT_161644 [Mycena amicta]|nr:hypothetical protein C8F01DRAFT_161644 [Mycena amicta]
MTRSHPHRLSVACKSPYSPYPFRQCDLPIHDIPLGPRQDNFAHCKPAAYPTIKIGYCVDVVRCNQRWGMRVEMSGRALHVSNARRWIESMVAIQAIRLPPWPFDSPTFQNYPKQSGARLSRTLTHSSPWSRPPLSSPLSARVLHTWHPKYEWAEWAEAARLGVTTTSRGPPIPSPRRLSASLRSNGKQYARPFVCS